MNKLSDYLPSQLCDLLSPFEESYLSSVLETSNGLPRLEKLFELMDEQWVYYDCDPNSFSEKYENFYKHPVWLLNGIFTEYDSTSRYNREVFSRWVVSQSPSRIGDIGGGFGSLSRLIAKHLPNVIVEIIEPFPHPVALALSSEIPNLSYKSQLVGQYDLMIATDVFEHLIDPLSVVLETSTYLSLNGHYLMANCFEPYILCHLPQHFHFKLGWSEAMRALGFSVGDRIGYGRSYEKISFPDYDRSLHIEKLSSSIYSLIDRFGKGKYVFGKLLLKSMLLFAR